jgi:hypothetical protein
MVMEAARTSETSVDNYFTRQYIPEDKSELHIRRRENLKSHIRKAVNDAFFPSSCHYLFPKSKYFFTTSLAKLSDKL